jgi:hypothetical protein
MKNKILFLTIAAIGALLITASNGFSKDRYGYDMNDACAPASPFTGSNCLLCHVDGGDRGEYTAAMDAYAAGGTTLTDYFCPTQSSCNDKDGDGYGYPADSSCGRSAEDCNDNNASVNPGAVENCNDRIDNDCDLLIDIDDPSAVNCPANCTDFDKDGYDKDGACGPVDCDDNDATINPGAVENCNDSIDNDCDGNIDSFDRDCYTCVQHKDRRNCKADPSCSWSGKNKECFQPVVYDNRFDCEEDGGRWNNKKESCSIR